MHHAFLYISSDSSLQTLPSDVQAPGTDVTHVNVACFGIDDVRTLQQLASVRPFVEPFRSFVICAKTLTPQAQNALLKILEEPPHSAQFFVVVPHENILLPTLRSRLMLVDTLDDRVANADWESFKTDTYTQRLARITKAAKDKDTVWLADMLEAAIYDKSTPRRAVLLLDTHGRASGASKKMLLELVAIVLP